jgi:L-methionine (R)-S-oxide reductase
MAETLHITGTGKAEKYHSLLPQLKALCEGETDLVANLANITAALKETFGFFWVGFYIVRKEQLVLGPFQGPLACTRISFGKGVCGTAWKEQRTILVPDVEQFPGHIACSSASRSEIVVPVKNISGEVVMVLDVDSDRLNDFDAADEQHLGELCAWIGQSIFRDAQ